jgi:hypothetical protein
LQRQFAVESISPSCSVLSALYASRVSASVVGADAAPRRCDRHLQRR